jgi:hypothetical protein
MEMKQIEVFGGAAKLFSREIFFEEFLLTAISGRNKRTYRRGREGRKKEEGGYLRICSYYG